MTGITTIIIAGSDRQALQRAITSVTRASDDTFDTIVIYDTTGAYGNQLAALPGSSPIPVLDSLDGLDHKSGALYCIVPSVAMVSSGWLAACRQAASAAKSTTIRLFRPEYHVSFDSSGQPTVTHQKTTLNPSYSLQSPAYSGVVTVNGTLLSKALADASLPFHESLAVGEPWLAMEAHIIPRTAVFSHSVPLVALASDYASLPCFSLEYARQHPVTAPRYVHTNVMSRADTERTRGALHLSKRVAKHVVRRTGLAPAIRKVFPTTPLPPATTRPAASNLSEWLITEWRSLHRLDNHIFPSPYIVGHQEIADKPSHDARRLAHSYTRLAAALPYDQYGYILFAPWLIRGGADKYAIEYANAIAKQRPGMHVLVVTTLEKDSVWATRLDAGVSHCDFAKLTAGCTPRQQETLLKTLIRQSGAKALHIINSELAYDFVASHGSWLQKTGIRVAATSFSQEIIDSGRVLGYSHSHMPEIYDSLSAITSDNTTVLTMWHQDYGFDKARTLLHHLPYVDDSAPTPPIVVRQRTSTQPMRVLWASRIAPEKIPGIAAQVGTLLAGDAITIDMYGTMSPDMRGLLPDTMPANVSYKGSFDGIASLPLDEYDAFLYTSLFDGMPNTLLEIGLAGLPVVSSAVGGIPELIQDGVTGLLIHNAKHSQAYATALRKLRDDPDLSVRLAQSLQDTVKHDYSARQFELAVDDLLRRLNV